MNAAATSLYRIEVLQGDCGPDRVVLADRYSRWLDAAAQEHLRACGVPLWRALDEPPGVLGALLVDMHMRFAGTAQPDDVLQVHTSVEAWHDDDIVLVHRVMLGDTLVCEAHETRALCAFDRHGRGRRVPTEAVIAGA